jgi:hypothetical protein
MGNGKTIRLDLNRGISLEDLNNHIYRKPCDHCGLPKILQVRTPGKILPYGPKNHLRSNILNV